VIGIQEKSVSSVAWSPDATQLASGEAVQVRNSSDGELLAAMDTGDGKPCSRVGWSPNGVLLAGGCQGGYLFIWDVATGAPLRVWSSHVLPVSSVAWSPNGLQIASGSPDGTLRIWNVVGGEQTLMLTNEVTDCQVFMAGQLACGIESIAWSPDGRQIAFGGDNRALQVWDLTSGQVRTIGYHPNADYVDSVAWSPDGRKIASTGGVGGTIRVWDLADTQSPYVLDPEAVYAVYGIAWSPDGQYLAATGSSSPDIHKGLIWIWSIQ
jgi:WD40 repeat protein